MTPDRNYYLVLRLGEKNIGKLHEIKYKVSVTATNC